MSAFERLFRRPLKPVNPARADALTVIAQDDALRITRIGDPDAPNAFICFTGIQHALGAINIEEFVGSTRLPGYCAFFVSDMQRSWFNGFPPEAVTGPLAPYVAGKRLVTLGNSMGGYGAIWLTRHMAIDTAIALCPQYSVHPDIVPEETRWAEYREAITHWRAASLDGHFVPATRYITLNGDGLDHIHWSKLPMTENCNHILISETGHDVAFTLKDKKILRSVIETAATGGDPLGQIVTSGMTARRLP